MRLLLILVSVLLLAGCSREQGAAGPGAAQITSTTGLQFVRALVEKRFADAHAMLGQEVKLKYTPEKLETEYLRLIAEIAPVTTVHENEAVAMTDWPDRRAREYGWIYVTISGDEDMEAITVVVSDENGTPKVTEIEWGRAD